MRSESNRIDALQALRACAAGMVVLAHAADTYKARVGGSFSDLPTLGLGSLGVQIFFCISGYIIFRSSAQLSGGWRSSRIFLTKRWIRIAPLYWLATAAYAVKLATQGDTPTVSHLFDSLMFVPVRNSDGLMRPVLGAGWTLNYEMFFYLLTGLSLLLSKQTRHFAIAALLIGLTALNAAQFISPSSNLILDGLNIITQPLLLFFIGGMAAALVQSSNLYLRLRPISYSVRLTATSLLIGALLILRGRQVLTDDSELLVNLPTFMCCVLLCAWKEGPPSTQTTSKFRGAFNQAGDASYSTYLTHGFVMGPCARLVSALGLSVSVEIFCFLMLLACTGIGLLIYRHIETPLLRHLNALLLDRWQPKQQRVAP